MRKKIVLSLILSCALNAGTYTMYAGSVESDAKSVIASDNVMIFHNSNVYRAKKAVFDKKIKLLKLIGDVTVINKNSTIKSDFINIKLDKDTLKSGKFFIFDTQSGLWLRGSEYFDQNKDIHIIKNSEVSSCNIEKPDWKILFKKAEFNEKQEFIYLYSPTFYFKNKPVFALPWFAFPTVRKRKSGLLRPEFGVKVDSGFIYMQPYFYAPSQSWDVEFTPQIRTSRGVGLYTTVRFADTPYSKGKVTFGSFYDKDSFVLEKSLKNSSHYGYDISYESHRFFDKFLKKDSYKDGLWLDFHYLNDIDYENLKNMNIKSLNKLVTSRFNYFLKRDRDYIGLYAKYFIDTDKENNDDTMQELPSFQYHRFTTNLPLKNLTYSIDYKVKNDYRKKGLNATLHEINLPLKLDIPLFSNYINFSISENLYYSKIYYRKRDGGLIKDLKYFSNYHKFIVSSDLTKGYKDFIHNLQLEASLQVPSFEDKDGDIADFISINKEEKNLKLSANQYFYNYDNFNYLTLRTSQTIYLDRDEDRYSDLYNEIIYKFSRKFTIHENIDYSNKYNKVKKVQSTLDYEDDFYDFSLSHTYQKAPDVDYVDYLTASLKFKLNQGYEFESSLDYDIDKSLTKSWSAKLFRDKGCWNYSIKYKESITPIFTSGGVKSYKNKGLYFLVNFANIGGISYEYTQDDVTDSGVKDE